MSCGCSNNINYPCGCGNSSCNSCSSTSCEQVVYTGPNLVCSGINNDDNLCVAIQKLDNAVCNPPGLTVTASNGLYKDLLLNDIRLGGPLTEQTVISTSGINTLSLTGLSVDSNPQYVLVQTNLGVIRKSLVSTITASVLALLTADNGLTYTSTNVQLGGPLIKPTTVTTGSTNTLAIAGLVSNPSATYVVSVDNSTGVLTKTALSAIIPTIITANNGLTKTGSNIQLGGPLVQNTTVDLATYKLTLKDSGAAPTGLEIVPGAADNNNWTTANVNIVTGKLSGVNNAKFDSNVGIGLIPSADQTTGTKLDVYRSYSAGSAFPTVDGLHVSKSDLLLSPAITGGDLNDSLYIDAAYNRVGLYATPATGKINAASTSEAHYCGTFSEFVYGAHGADTTSYGRISASAARGYFIYDSDIDTFITTRIMPPVSDAGSPFTGSINELVGIRIDNQRANTVINSVTTKSYGIQQKGSSDYNEFAGMTYFAENVGVGTYPEPHTSSTSTNDTRLAIYKATAYSNNPIAVATSSTLEMPGDLGSGGTSIYAGVFGNIVWSPTSNEVLPTLGSLAGTSAYLSLASAYDTTGGYMSASASQIYTTAASSIFISGVNSSGAVITVPAGTDMTKIQSGYQVIFKGGVGNLGYVNTYVDTVNISGHSFTIKRISGGSRGAWTYTTGVVPSVALSNASILVAKANSGNDLGSIDIAIGARVLPPVADRYAGSSVRIDSAVGLQIDNQRFNIPSPSVPWNPSTDVTPGYLSETYGIKQLGNNDKNLYNAIINQLPNLPVYANNAAAVAGGLAVGTVYRTSTGELRIVI